ncbi:DUF1878 family protein [Paenibacillus lentus]|uniref:DUF1878 family protein n=1 Tax=Paenibacillus lentus TaxID=1338368 RepID=A0A3Q8SDG1_9BACL|nr:DUF1878 family protein [Paenibacillus lentus]AZK48249.1 DUF1878 family protein [Paenibacillus lentus]
MPESLEEKVQRLELYVNLLRQITLEPEQYRLWDWIIANGLNGEQFNEIKSILKKYVLLLQHEQVPQPTSFDDMANELIHVLSPNEYLANRRGVKQAAKKSIKMSPYQSLQYYLNDSQE